MGDAPEGNNVDDSWYHIPTLVAIAHDAVASAATEDDTPDDTELLNVGDVFGDKLENRRPSFLPPMLYECRRLGSLEEATALVDDYFESIGYQYPFLYRVMFMKDMQRIYRGKSVSCHAHFSYHITMAISILISSNDETASERFYRDSRVSFPRVLDGENLAALQALLSMSLYALFSSSGPSVWHLLGVCLRLAASLGLQKSNLPDKSADLIPREMERRTFWSLYALDRLIAVTLNRPLGISDADVTAQLPQQFDEPWEMTGEICPISIPVHVFRQRQIFFFQIYQTCEQRSVVKVKEKADDDI